MNGWISVKERLPEEGTLCVVLEAGRRATFIYLANFKQGLFRCTEEYEDYADYEIFKATHWIPVPSFP